MNIESYREYCLSFPGVTEEFPFDDRTLVMKVGGKMFALFDVDKFEFINLKCDPEHAVELREQYRAVQPGYHMSKKHWNSVYIEQDVVDKHLLDLTSHSYALVKASLPAKIKQEL